MADGERLEYFLLGYNFPLFMSRENFGSFFEYVRMHDYVGVLYVYACTYVPPLSEGRKIWAHVAKKKYGERKYREKLTSRD